MYNAIVWQDRRTAGYCGERKARGLEPMVRAKTGLPIDAYFSATKIRWILDQVEGARENARAGRRDIGELQRHWSLERRFAHSLPRGDAARRLAGWQRAIVAAKSVGRRRLRRRSGRRPGIAGRLGGTCKEQKHV